jgi:hypothetical protein
LRSWVVNLPPVRNRKRGVRRKPVPKRRPPREALGRRLDNIRQIQELQASMAFVLAGYAASSLAASSLFCRSSAKRRRRGVPEPASMPSLPHWHSDPGIAMGRLAGTAIVRFAAQQFHGLISEESLWLSDPARRTSVTIRTDICFAVIAVVGVELGMRSQALPSHAARGSRVAGRCSHPILGRPTAPGRRLLSNPHRT